MLQKHNAAVLFCFLHCIIQQNTYTEPKTQAYTSCSSLVFWLWTWCCWAPKPQPHCICQACLELAGRKHIPLLSILFYLFLHYHCQWCWGSRFVHSSSSWGRGVWPERSLWRWRTDVPCCCHCGLEERPWSLHCHCIGPWTYSGENIGVIKVMRNLWKAHHGNKMYKIVLYFCLSKVNDLAFWNECSQFYFES